MCKQRILVMMMLVILKGQVRDALAPCHLCLKATFEPMSMNSNL